MSSAQKLLSEKGKPMICYLGHIYTKEISTEVKIIFQCQNRSCIGSIFSRNNEGKELLIVIFSSRLSHKLVNGYFSL